MYHSKKILQQKLIVVVTVILFVLTLLYYMNQEKTEHIFSEEGQTKDSYFQDIYLCGYQDSLQAIKLFKAEENSYYVFMPAEMRTDVYVRFDDFKELQIGDTVYSNGSELTDIYQPNPYIMRAKDWSGNVVEEAEIRFYFSVEVPSVYIESLSGSLEKVNQKKGVKEKTRFTVISKEGNRDAYGECTIKARGNTSFQTEQKSYSLNLENSQSLLGMPQGTEWALLANYRNTIQQLKNKIALDIAGMLKMRYTPECKYVNVYIDNQYNGLYLLTQKVSADGGSVQFENSKNQLGNLTGPYLLEFDARYKEEPVWFQTDRKNIVIKFPKVVSDEQKSYITAYLQETEETIFSKNGIHELSGKSYEDYLDLESWVKMYLMQEFFVQWDVNTASFFVYKLKNEEPIYAGPIWDFDLAYGELYYGSYPQLTKNTFFLQDNRKSWLGKLGEYPVFKNEIIEKYSEELSPILEQYLQQEFGSLVDSLSSSSYMNLKRWGRGDADIRTDAEQLRQWIVDRKNFLDEYIENPDAFRKILFEFSWGPMSYYGKKGDVLGFLPSEAYGEIAYIRDKESDHGEIIGWKNKEGTQIDAMETIIEKDMVLYPIYEQDLPKY